MKGKLTIIAQTLGADPIEIFPEKNLEDLIEWDSLGTIKFILMLEQKYNYKLSENDIDSLKTVEDLLKFMQ